MNGQSNNGEKDPTPQQPWDGSAPMPTSPPVEDDRGRPAGMPATPPVVGETSDPTRVNETAEEDKKANNRFKTAITAGAAVVATVAVILMAKGCSDDGGSNPKETTTTTIAGNSKGEVCEGGYFSTNEPYAAFKEIMPGDLTQAPSEPLTDKASNLSLRKYWIGDKNKEGQGVLCENPVASAAVYVALREALGQGATLRTDFDPYVKTANEVAKYWAEENKEMQGMQSMQEFLESYEFDSAILNAAINEEAIVKSVYKIGTLGQNTSGEHIIVQEKVDAKLDKGTVLVLEFTKVLNDSRQDITSGQIMYIDIEDGTIYLAKGLGDVPDITPTTTTTTVTTAPPNLPPMTIDLPNSDNGGNGGGNGGGTGGNGGGNGGGTGGNGGGTGGGNGGGNGGNGGGNGGGTGGGNGGGGTGGGNGGGGTPTTIYHPPTTTRPPVTTVPPTPTTQPKGPEITIPGAPN